jgi:hypothetical protein
MLSSRIGEAANEAHFFKASEILYGKARLKSRCGTALVDGADFSYGNSFFLLFMELALNKFAISFRIRCYIISVLRRITLILFMK